MGRGTFTVENVVGVGEAFFAMRNPMDSWDKASYQKDLDLHMRLCKGGTEHRKHTRMIHIYWDCTMPLYWWKEFDTYRLGESHVSCSTMHTIHKHPFTEDMFATHRLGKAGEVILADNITGLNWLRSKYLETNDKDYWYEIIQSLPSSFLQRRTGEMSFETALKIIRERKNHKLDEWHWVCDELLKSVPYLAETAYEMKYLTDEERKKYGKRS